MTGREREKERNSKTRSKSGESEKLRGQSRQVGLGKDVCRHESSKTTFWDEERGGEREGRGDRQTGRERERELER